MLTNAHSLPARLKEATAPLHDSVERALPLAAPGLTLDAYRRILAAFLGFYVPLEAALIRVARRWPRDLDLLGREKISRLRQDLKTLGATEVDLAAVPLCPTVPRIEDVPRALGCMYVLEGATLGGRVVSRSIHENLSIDAHGGGSFFQAYGVETAPMWRSFVARLNRQPPPFDEVVTAALETFERFEHWLRDRGAPGWR